jgi:hypothetical protein
MQSARAWQSHSTVVPGRPRRGVPDRRTLRRVAAGLCLLLALYCLLAAAVSLAQTPAGSDLERTPAPRDRLPLLIPLIFLVFLVVTAAVVRRKGRPATGLPESPPRRSRHR